jgi:hypothetical protein
VASTEELLTLCETLAGYSNADLEALALLAVEAARNQASALNAAVLTAAALDFMPPQERDMIEFMELLAVSETSRRTLLPKRFRDMATADIQSNLQAARKRALAR